MKTSLLIVVAACHSSSAVAPPAAPPPPPPPAADPHAAVVDSLVGVWAGKAIGTPSGDMPFALAFERQPDGAVHAHTEQSPGTYLDFTFRRMATSWVLVEAGAIPKAGSQTHTLAATSATHWTDSDVDVELGVTGDALVMTTTVHGKPHARFELARKTGSEAERIRTAISSPTK
jgi:hypothetical protein